LKKTGFLKAVIILLAIIAVAVKAISQFYVPYLWFKDLGYTEFFLTPIVAKIGIGVISFLIFFLIVFFMGLIAYKVFVNAERDELKTKSKIRLISQRIILFGKSACFFVVSYQSSFLETV